MLNLIKYELIRKYKLFLITIFSSLGLNLYLLTKGASGSFMFLGLFPVVIAVLYIVDIIKMYGDDLNFKTGYMLFMTPNSGYKIIVSKLITAVLEGLIVLGLYFIIVLTNGAYIIYRTGADINISEILQIINHHFIDTLGFSLYHIFLFLLTAVIFIIAFLTTVYAAMTIRKSIFSEIKFGGILSFIIFLFINWIISRISLEFYKLINSDNTIIYYASSITPEQFINILLPINIFSIAQSIVLTIFSGYLLENKINL